MAGVVEGDRTEPAPGPPLPQRRAGARRPPPLGPHRASTGEVSPGLLAGAPDGRVDRHRHLGRRLRPARRRRHLLAEPIAYRDDRTAKVIDAVHDRRPPDELYAINGLQFLPFNTIYQLAAERRGPLGARPHVVLLPDLLAYWLTGELRHRGTNASTTGLLDVRTRHWSTELLDRLGHPGDGCPDRAPGEIGLTTRAAEADGLPGTASSPRSARTTPPPRSSASPRPPIASPTSPAAPGRWSASSSTSRSSPRRAGRRTSPTRLASTAGSGSCATSAGCGCCRSACARGTAGRPTSTTSSPRPPLGPPAARRSTSTTRVHPARRHARADRRGRPGARPARDPGETCAASSTRSPAAAATVARPPSSPAPPSTSSTSSGGGSQNELLCQLTADAAGLSRARRPGRGDRARQRAVQARAHGALPASLEDIRAGIAASTTDLDEPS